VGSPELSVVCKNCGSEVSPYVTECPYCGQRLRKRAPKIGRLGEEAPDPRPRRRPRVPRPEWGLEGAGRPWATIVAVAAGAVLALVARASPNLTVVDLGAIVGPPGSEWWRYLAAPFVYPDLGYLFICGSAIAVLGISLERRLGTVPVALLLLACAGLGMLAADGIESLLAGSGTETIVAAGGNGVALGLLAVWYMLDRAERRHVEIESDLILAAVAGIVLVALPIVNDWASWWAGLAGGVVGLACGQAAAAGRLRA
jgi:membrane associated rhomboid family serine protease